MSKSSHFERFMKNRNFIRIKTIQFSTDSDDIESLWENDAKEKEQTKALARLTLSLPKEKRTPKPQKPILQVSQPDRDSDYYEKPVTLVMKSPKDRLQKSKMISLIMKSECFSLELQKSQKNFEINESQTKKDLNHGIL